MTEESTTMTTTHAHSMQHRLPLLVLALAAMTSVLSAQSYSQEITYVSRGKNPQLDHGTFVLNGPTGRADYRLGGQPFVTVFLRRYLEQPSSTSPWIRYLIYKDENHKTRLWSFQVDGASPGEFVIYVNESGEWWLPHRWAFYDLSHKYPEQPEVLVHENVVISTASPVYYSSAEPAHCCWGLFCHHWY